MCDFHSVVVTGDGRILHLPSNSHSDIARHHGLGVDLAAKWWECEWDGRGKMPVKLVQTRGKDTEPTQVAQRVAERHYDKLAKIVAGDIDPQELFPFDQPEYSDVRAVYAQAAVLKHVGPTSELLEGMSVNAVITFIRELAEAVSVDMADIATEEIKAAEQSSQESGYECGYKDGLEAACEDMYSYEELDAARQEGYEEGYFACKQGKPLPVGYVNEMPSFLF